MATESEIPYLRNMYAHQNQLQALGKNANDIFTRLRIQPFRGHLGNPTAPQYRPTNQVVSEYYALRDEMSENTGYMPYVGGHEAIREVIANALNKINRLEKGPINAQNVLGVTGGTGALNIALSVTEDPTILVSEPSYPPWEEITQRLNARMERYELKPENDYLLKKQDLEEAISKCERGKPIVLIYHYPHNPTGKALSEHEAVSMGRMLSELCEKYPQLFLVQEDLYLATTAPEKGIYTPLPHLTGGAKERVVWLHSPSKMGHAQDRGAIVAAFNEEMVTHLRGAISFDMLGTSTASLLATASTLKAIADGGVDGLQPGQSRESNYRYEVGGFYQDRLKIVYEGLQEIQTAVAKTGHNQPVIRDMPGGAYYLYPDFSFLRNKEIPAELLEVFNQHQDKSFHGKTKFENAKDIALALEYADRIGLRPMTVAPGTLFERDPAAMTMRISTVDPELEIIREGANTLKGLVQKTLGLELGAEFKTVSERQEAEASWSSKTNHAAKLTLRSFLEDRQLLQRA